MLRGLTVARGASTGPASTRFVRGRHVAVHRANRSPALVHPADRHRHARPRRRPVGTSGGPALTGPRERTVVTPALHIRPASARSRTAGPFDTLRAGLKGSSAVRNGQPVPSSSPSRSRCRRARRSAPRTRAAAAGKVLTRRSRRPLDADLLQWIVPIAGHRRRPVRPLPRAGRPVARQGHRQAMQDVGDTIHEGAVAFIRRQYTTIAILALVGAVIIGIVIGSSRRPKSPTCPSSPVCRSAIMTAFAFLVGAACSMARGHHRHVHQRPLQRADRGGRPAQPRRGRPGRDARRRRLGLPRRRPVAARRLGHLHALRRPSSATSPSPRRRS